MRSVNKVILIGNLTRDPELRQTANGQNVVTFGMATNREWVSNGEKKSSAEFHECVAWEKLAEICQKYLKKGSLIHVEGYLKTRSWETPEGIKKFKTEIVVQDMIMLDKKFGGPSEEDSSSKTDAPHDADAPQDIEEPPASQETEPAPPPSDEDAPEEENPIDKDLGL